MWVVPKCSTGFSSKNEAKRASRLNGTLCNQPHSIHEVSAHLALSMPVNRYSFSAEIIVNVDCNYLSFMNYQETAC